MSQNGPFLDPLFDNIALKEAKLGPERVQKSDGRTDGRTNERKDAHQIFEALYTKALGQLVP